mmetsp:Transcript_93423/g.166221  ORF Transcript_93423/g.166221 Transcript_93423/m.166221 type:complete len:555 (+) Transcript_93423:136-1800(+)|eukprot:CAMPEP_0197625804 /NCGR_PEP_ID=MMETSP1338-20131121/5062_1 /TAXON_ID=43686 ORGANISM="Pelagodinium beii, Strain RCC1491" /NCGR_SAMPLE_ID=MMETSP1338 /ASSEMBLY_ACC=CAM_ASM_000754 /LENGTH=554 /DNA_ID=CAMNT_0043196295 /DNA_START=130 /DNA_END=1794 /DNA_ORIENTATION=-
MGNSPGSTCTCSSEAPELPTSALQEEEEEAVKQVDTPDLSKEVEQETTEIGDEPEQEEFASYAETAAEAKKLAQTWSRPDFFTEKTKLVPCTALSCIIENPCQFKDFYATKAKLGAGKFGQVREAHIITNGVERAVKTVAKKDMINYLDTLRTEIILMKMLDHPNLVSICEIFENSLSVFFVMKLCKGSNLQTYVENVGHLTEMQSAVMMQDLFRGLAYMHYSQVSHRDLKAENLLLSTLAPIERNKLKLCDFGLSKQFSESKPLSGRVGSHTHMAPEVLQYSERYTCGCDNWSCGIILFHLLCGVLPFDEEENVLNDTLSFANPNWSEVGEGGHRLVELLLDRNVETRLTALDALGNSWLSANVQKARSDANEAHLEKTATAKEPKPPSWYPERIWRFRNFNRFKQAALRVVANMMSEFETAATRDFFLALDRQCRGSIRWEDLCEEVGFDDAKGGDGKNEDISYTELLAATLEKKKLSEKMCKAAYQSFDKSADQLVSLTDLKEGRLIGPLTAKEFEKVVREIGEGEDDTVDFSAFFKMMRTDRIRVSPRFS